MGNKEILFLSKGEHAASTRYRALNYFPALRARGWKPIHITAGSSPLARWRILRRARQAEVVVVLRRMFTGVFPRLLGLCSRHLVFDLDDAIFCRSDGSPSKQRRKRFQKMLRHCEQVWAGNTYLAGQASRYNRQVITLPTALAPEKYFLQAEAPRDVVDLVWIGSSATRRYLESAISFLEEAAAEASGRMRLKIVADFGLKPQKLETLALPWSEETEARDLASSHIGIAPMPDDSWTKGKCGLKILQYMAAGLPVISSPAGVNRDIVEHGGNGYLAETPEEWRSAIQTLASDRQLRPKMGAAGRERVLAHYCVDAVFERMAAALEELA